jgi:hypothetical protein
MKFWADNPSILFDSQYITEIWVYSNMDTNQKLNAISRLVILLSLIGYVCFNRYIIFILGLIILGVIVIIHKSGKKEGFTDVEEYQRITSNNPLQNLLLPEYKYKEPDRVAPKYDKQVEDNINENAKNFILQENKDNADIGNIFSNLGDKFEFEQSMRPFYTNPVTSVGQTEYGDFLGYLFGSLPSDKPLKKY